MKVTLATTGITELVEKLEGLTNRVDEIFKRLDEMTLEGENREVLRDSIYLLLESQIDANNRSTKLLAETILPVLKNTYDKMDDISEVLND